MTIVTAKLRKQRIAHQTYHGGIRLSRGVAAYQGMRLRSLVGVVGEFMLLCSRVMLDHTLDEPSHDVPCSPWAVTVRSATLKESVRPMRTRPRCTSVASSCLDDCCEVTRGGAARTVGRTRAAGRRFRRPLDLGEPVSAD